MKSYLMKSCLMKSYHFSLVLSGVDRATKELEDAFYEAGCDDALICFYNGSVYLEFDRVAQSFEVALSSAIRDVESVRLQARVESVDAGDFVGLSDMAKLSGLSRQAIALLKDGKRGDGSFPSPVLRLEGSQPLWKWSRVARWLFQQGKLAEELALNAELVDKYNRALALRSSSGMNEIIAIARSLPSS